MTRERRAGGGTLLETTESNRAGADEPRAAAHQCAADAGQAGAAGPPDPAGATAFDRLLTPARSRPLARLPALTARAVRLVRHAAGPTFTRAAVLQLVGGLGAAAQVLLVRALLAALLSDDGSAPLRETVPPAAGLVLVSAVVAYAMAAQREHQRLVGELTGRYATDQVLQVASAVEAVSFEHPGFHDRLRRAQVNAQLRPVQLAAGVLGLLGAGIGLAAVAVALATISPLFCLLLVVAAGPGVLANLRASALLHDFERRRTEPDRRRAYLFHVLGTKDHAAEIRSFDLGEPLRSRHDQLQAERIADLRTVTAGRLRWLALGTAASAAITLLAFLLLLVAVSRGGLGLADAAAAAGGTLLLTQRVQALAAASSSLLESALFVEDFTSFVDELPALATPLGTSVAPPSFGAISAVDVSFSYPASGRAAVDGVSLDLRAGEVVALVGENGSGKTTLAKILAGLLAPSAGTIRWDGVETSSIDPRSLRDRVTVIYQDFAQFHLSAGENITLGRWREAGDTDRRQWAATVAGVDGAIAHLPFGFDTQLGPEFFGGTDLSVGQWQRLALARAVFRDAPLVILDEPAAALDPRAEAELFADARSLFPGKTVLLISHRFANVRTADRIYVLAGGRVVERGDHDTLVAHKGLYAELYQLQARGYQP